MGVESKWFLESLLLSLYFCSDGGQWGQGRKRASPWLPLGVTVLQDWGPLSRLSAWLQYSCDLCQADTALWQLLLVTCSIWDSHLCFIREQMRLCAVRRAWEAVPWFVIRGSKGSCRHICQVEELQHLYLSDGEVLRGNLPALFLLFLILGRFF